MSGMSTPALRIAIIGGGAAGFFAAITAAEADPTAQVSLFEGSHQPLAKVRISGGGRCNTTHACFEPRELVKRYPRGSRELLGTFTRFGPRQTVDWFASRGVTLVAEEDGRMFPSTNDSATIVNCLLECAARAGVRVNFSCSVRSVLRLPAGGFQLVFTQGGHAEADRLLLATGGTGGNGGHELAASLGHAIEPLVPSLFTFKIADPVLQGLEGLAVPTASASIKGSKLRETGPVLITHWGLSGPAILRLSAWGARELSAAGHRFTVLLNWAAPRTQEQVFAELCAARGLNPRKQLGSFNPVQIPARLWERLAVSAGIAPATVWSSVSNTSLQTLAARCAAGAFEVSGRSANKEEFVTCGGVRLAEVDFRTLQSRLCPGLHFAGELLDIDGITGGFNFQAAWTTGWLAGKSLVTQ
jgi:predicted Rossmann fold flavoprotein